MPSIASKNSRARILIVEDDPVMAGSLVELFTMDGYQAAVAKNGSTAKAKLQELHPDLVILDLMLPDIDGLVLCSELSRAAVPFIVCSGTNRQRDRILARRLGADDFIAKPFDMYEFEARVAAVLRRSVTADQTRRTDQPNEPRVETGGVTQELRVGEMLLSRSRSALCTPTRPSTGRLPTFTGDPGNSTTWPCSTFTASIPTSTFCIAASLSRRAGLATTSITSARRCS